VALVETLTETNVFEYGYPFNLATK
jgi:hypothetical protein